MPMDLDFHGKIGVAPHARSRCAPESKDVAASNPSNRVGVCQLTGTRGLFVDSHLIPRALTRLTNTSEKAVETGIGYGIKRRSNSWYDRSLVTRAGEDILAAIDNRGIQILRAHRLVWSAWGPEKELNAPVVDYDPGKNGFRYIELDDPAGLQLFFLSLVWRAAASSLTEFADVMLDNATLEDVRQRVLHQSIGDYADYPVQLFQMITRGAPHNRTPLLERKPMVLTDASTGPDVPYVRFYFDGLVAHVHLGRGVAFTPLYLKTCIGPHDKLIIFAYRYEESRTADNIREMMQTWVRDQSAHRFALNAITGGICTKWPRPPATIVFPSTWW